MTNHELDLAVAEAMGMEVGDLRDETSLGASVLVKQWYSEDGYILVDATRRGWSPSTDANLAIECAGKVFPDGWEVTYYVEGFEFAFWYEPWSRFRRPSRTTVDSVPYAICLAIVEWRKR